MPKNLRMPASKTWVYTPPGYDRARTTRYPVAYLIHGSPGNSADWVSAGDIAHVMDVFIAGKLVRPMIVVAPDVNGTGQSDTPSPEPTTPAPTPSPANAPPDTSALTPRDEVGTVLGNASGTLCPEHAAG